MASVAVIYSSIPLDARNPLIGAGHHKGTMASIRTFPTGATRDAELGKPDYEGFLSPLVLKRFGEYMLTHQTRAEGGYRASDNWQLGIPIHEYLKSAFRHFMDVWLWARHPTLEREAKVDEALTALLFNVQGMLHERLMGR